MKLLITGAAGFIGFHLACRLQQRSDLSIVGLDSVNNYYDVHLKWARLAELGVAQDNVVFAQKIDGAANFSFIRMNLEDRQKMSKFFADEKFDLVVHLAAQAGVRYSLTNPYAYLDSNLAGFLNILEGCRHNEIRHLIYASSSSVYGMNDSMPFSVHDSVDYPVSLYAATKKANELMAHSYSHLYGLPSTGLRFFTVYGPWGRPDMAYFSFTQNILSSKPIQVFNNGDLQRDFTFIDDIIDGMVRILNAPPPQKSNVKVDRNGQLASTQFCLYNIGNNQPVRLLDFISAIEEALGKSAVKEMLPMQAGDVLATWADVDGLIQDFDYSPDTPLKDGIKQFIHWYMDFYDI